MKVHIFSVSAITAFAVMTTGAALMVPNSASGDLNVPALACQAPFLDQAEPMRWHEHFLMNPPGNRTTWVVCPLPVETDVMNNTFTVGAFGNFIPNAAGSEAPLCYVNIIDITNQHIQEFWENPGQMKVYQRLLDTQNPINTIWSVASNLSVAEINARLNSPCANPPDCWGVSLNCKLPPGYGLNMVSQW